MRLEDELRQLFEETNGAPWPGEQQAFDRFLRRRARRGRMAAATAGLALVAVLGAAVLVARPQPKEREPVAPAGGVVRVPTQGFELAVPDGWKLQRQLTRSGSQVVGVVLVPRSGQPHGAAITVTAHDDQELTPSSSPGTPSSCKWQTASGPTGGCTRCSPAGCTRCAPAAAATSPPARVRSAPMSSPGMPGPPRAGRCRCPPGSHQPARGPPFGSCW